MFRLISVMFKLLAGVVSIFLAGCSPRQKEISGCVFIVTAGAETKKLGLVPVQIYTQEKVDAANEVARNSLMPELDLLKKKETDLQAIIKEKTPLLADMRKQIEESFWNVLESNRKRPQMPHSSSFSINPTGSAASNVDLRIAAEKAYRSAVAAYETDLANWKGQHANLEAQAEQKRQASADLTKSIEEAEKEASAVALRIKFFNEEFKEMVFRNLSNPVTSSKTDGDGNFSLSIPSAGNLVIAASASRKLIDSNEMYFWLFKIPENLPTKKIIDLNNDNLLKASFSESAIRLPLPDP